ncbi:MAG TPA: hypothetical protein VK158_05210 [Acidobacteriota bacterium]|nr:hypothetical protein [Acidobacteriota bacterium]
MNYKNLVRKAVASAALILAPYTAPATVIQTGSVSVAAPLRGVSVDASNVRGSTTNITFVYDLNLANGSSHSNPSDVIDIATGTSANSQTSRLLFNGTLGLYNNASPSTLVSSVTGLGSLGLGVGGAVNNGSTTYQTFLDNAGNFKLVDFGTQTASTQWTLPSIAGSTITGLDTFLRPGGTVGDLNDYATMITRANGTLTFFNVATGAQLGSTITLPSLSGFGFMTDGALDTSSWTLYGSFNNSGTGYINSYSFSDIRSDLQVVKTPDSGSTLLLAGIAAAGLAFATRKKRSESLDAKLR